MKKRVISLCCVFAYFVVPVIGVTTQAFLSSQVTVVRHAINDTEYRTMPASWQARKRAPQTPVSL
tara:strand:+ start:324 stop:518 length:195 start_codon:yes stop_codon:yes gene_type:complete